MCLNGASLISWSKMKCCNRLLFLCRIHVLNCASPVTGARAAGFRWWGDFLHANGSGLDGHGWGLNPCWIFGRVPSFAQPSWHGIQDQKLLQTGKLFCVFFLLVIVRHIMWLHLKCSDINFRFQGEKKKIIIQKTQLNMTVFWQFVLEYVFDSLF